MRVWTLDERQSHCSRFTSDMFNQTIPKEKRPFLGLKVHSLTQNMRPFLYIFVMFLSWPFRDINTLFIDVLRGIQGLSKAEMTCVEQFICLNSVRKKYTSVFLSWNSYLSASQVIFSSYGNLAKLLNYRQLCIDFF
jgi:hypothetical protein